jgi:hypothetical protein
MNKDPCIFYRDFFPHLVQKNSTPLKDGKDKGNLIESGTRLWAIGDGIEKERWTRDDRSPLPQDEFGGQVAGTREKQD